ncbi:TolC family protein [Ascidiimonas sp. W6]|uniref:TolC family protein n=1 Tax=Ascidiimonas meishanensis TaxID=3128903 RepID=UPI0030EBC25B
MKKIIFILPVLFLCHLAIAQEKSYSFTMDEAVAFGLENNRIAKNASRDIEAAKKQQWEAISIGLPQISATVDYQNFLKQQVSLIPAEFFGGEPGEFSEVIFGTKQNVNAFATLSQVIFDGSYLVGLQSSKVFLEISKNAKEKTDLQVRQQVIQAYGNVLLTQESLFIAERNVAALQKNVNETQKIFENGLTEEEDLEQLQITLANLESDLSNLKRLLSLSYQMLNITLGLDLDAKVTTTDTLESLTMKNAENPFDSAPFLIENNIDYKIAFNNQRSQELLVKLEKSKALPSLDAFINGGYQGFGDEFTFLNGDQRWFGNSLLGVSLQVPIFSSLQRSARTQRAKINFEKAKAELTETKLNIKFEHKRALSNYQFSIEQYVTSKKNLNLAERIERKNQIKYTEGIASSFELRQAQLQLYSSQREFLQAMIDVITAQTILETIQYSGDIFR